MHYKQPMLLHSDLDTETLGVRMYPNKIAFLTNSSKQHGNSNLVSYQCKIPLQWWKAEDAFEALSWLGQFLSVTWRTQGHTQHCDRGHAYVYHTTPVEFENGGFIKKFH